MNRLSPHILGCTVALLMVPFSSNRCAAQGEVPGRQTSAFELNRAELRAGEELRQTLAQVVDAYGDNFVDSIVVEGSASPDGSWQHNRRLALRRAEAVRNYFCRDGRLPLSLFEVRTLGENEPLLREYVSRLPESPEKLSILNILDLRLNPDAKEARLKALDGGKVWRMLMSDIFPHLRRATTVVYLSTGERITETVSDAMEITPPNCNAFAVRELRIQLIFLHPHLLN